MRVVARRQYGITALVAQTSFCEGSCGDLARRRLFSFCTVIVFGFVFQLHHGRVIDTSLLYGRTGGAFFKSSLRSLAKQHLK